MFGSLGGEDFRKRGGGKEKWRNSKNVLEEDFGELR
jgi:hypothetical protein